MPIEVASWEWRVSSAAVPEVSLGGRTRLTPGGRVTLNGRYGAHHPRQRYQCYLPQVAAHTFTGTLVRQVVEPGEACEHCERLLASHEG